MRDRLTSTTADGGASPGQSAGAAPGPSLASNGANDETGPFAPAREDSAQGRHSKPTLKEGPGGPSALAADPSAERLTDEIWKGELIAGKYRVEEVIGKGGMGVVLRARHVALDEPVAIKVLRPLMMDVPGMVTRFTREARAASKIKSPHVARVTDVDVLASGVPYMVLEYLEGVDLLSALRSRKGPFAIDEAVGHVIDACDAIAEAHDLGIVHRDLKPGNLFLARRRDGQCIVKVLDFGISKVEGAGDADTTRTGQLMGSPKYMSPEQMASMRDVDGRSDIWALGAILYELCTGRPPFVAETMPLVCSLVLNSEPAPPRSLREDLPPDLEAVILRCLQKDPGKRFARVADLVSALAPFGPAGARGEGPPASRAPAPASTTSATATPRPLEHTPTATPAGTVSDWDPPRVIEPTPRRASRVAMGAVALVIALGAAIAWLGRGPESSAAPPGSPARAPAGAGEAPQRGTTVPTVTTTDPAVPTVTTVNAPGIPVSALPPATPEPPKGPLPTKKPRPAADPFGGSRN